MKPKKTWILIADAGSARVVENCGPGKGIHQLFGLNCQVDAILTPYDVPGRSFESATPMRHKLESQTPSQKSVIRFSEEIAQRISAWHRKDRFDRLILCAAPQMLSLLRKKLGGPVRSDVVAEISKDLTHVPTNQLSVHFEDVLAV